jgi:hypothetical protein
MVPVAPSEANAYSDFRKGVALPAIEVRVWAPGGRWTGGNAPARDSLPSIGTSRRYTALAALRSSAGAASAATAGPVTGSGVDSGAQAF